MGARNEVNEEGEKNKVDVHQRQRRENNEFVLHIFLGNVLERRARDFFHLPVATI